MKAVATMIALLACASGVRAQAPDDGGEPASTAVSLGERDTRMTVAVTIDGAGPFRFIVDSGATRTVVSRELAAVLHLPAGPTVSLHSVGGESTAPTARITRMRIGGLTVGPIVAPLLAAADLGGAGILGIDALEGRKVVIDVAQHTMTVETAGKRARATTPYEIVVSARRRYGQLVLADADAAGQRIYAIVDTGSMATIGNNALATQLVRRRRANPARVAITDVVGRRIVAWAAPIASLRIANWELSGLTIAFSDAHAFRRFGLADKPAMLVGMDVLQSFDRVAIDFRNRQVRFTRVAPT